MSNDDDRTTPFFRLPAGAVRGPDAHARFRGFAGAKAVRRSPWAAPLLTAIAVVHLAVFAVLWARSVWDLDQLSAPRDSIDLAVAPPPPAPPPPPPGADRQFIQSITPKRRVVKELVRFELEDRARPEETPATATGGPDVGATEHCDPAAGECGTDPDGVISGVADGVPPPRPIEVPTPPPAPTAPTIVPARLLEGQRIAGTSQVSPDDTTKTAISRSGKTRISGTFKACIAASGSITQVTLMKSTSFPAYDQRIVTEMKAWKYRPYLVNGKAVPVCTAVTFVYSQT